MGIFKMPSLILTLLSACVGSALLLNYSTGTKLYEIHWNTTNPIFRIDNTDHIIDVNQGNIPFEYDQVNIICPSYSPTGSKDDDQEKYIIYNVSKEEYDTCRITNPNPRVIAVCDKPYRTMYFTITFRSFTPQPGGLEFKPGQDYYFISTSSQDNIHRRLGGRCKTNNMKVVFKVCCGGSEELQKNVIKNSILRSSETTTRRITTSSSTTSTSSTSTPVSTSTKYTQQGTSSTYRITSFKSFEVPIFQKTTTKKSEPYDPRKHPNEVVKSEELAGSGCRDHRAAHALIGLACLLSFILPTLIQR